VTVDETSSTRSHGGPGWGLWKGASVLVLGLVNDATSTTTITAAEVDVQPYGDGGAWVGKKDGVLPADPGKAGPDKSVGVIPSDYTEGTGTLVSGAVAYAAVTAAQAVFPGLWRSSVRPATDLRRGQDGRPAHCGLLRLRVRGKLHNRRDKSLAWR
jgi:hypothetical protein